jgi:hypothetical protein
VSPVRRRVEANDPNAVSKFRRREMPMKSFPLPTYPVELGLRCTARFLAVFLIGLVLLFLVGDGGLNLLKLTPVETVQMFFFFTTLIGLVIAWRKELLGGTISVVGILCFFTVEYVVTGRFPRGPAFYLMLLPGILFLLNGLIRRGLSARA